MRFLKWPNLGLRGPYFQKNLCFCSDRTENLCKHVKSKIDWGNFRVFFLVFFFLHRKRVIHRKLEKGGLW